MNALYGIQVDAGKLHLSDTLEILGIDDWAPPLSADEKQATIADLLQARSGVYHPAAYETYNMRVKRPPRGSHPHGTHWFYNNWDFNSLVTIYEQQTGIRMGEAFYAQIALPLKMEQFRLSDTLYFYELEKSRHPALLFVMSARDLARFGLLYLRNGKWNEQQILSENWIQESMTPYTHLRSKNYLEGYGYLWWVSDMGFAAVGSGGQTLIVIPELRLVVVHLAEKIVGNRMQAHSKVAKLVKIIISAHPSANKRQVLMP
jgi:CubicO group peptidase (beta-lactamase class C family)